jgi:hypothetical protein
MVIMIVVGLQASRTSLLLLVPVHMPDRPDEVMGKVSPGLLSRGAVSGMSALPAIRSSCSCVSCASSSIGSWIQLGLLLLLKTCKFSTAQHSTHEQLGCSTAAGRTHTHPE